MKWSAKDAEMMPYDASVELDFSCGRQRVAHSVDSADRADWFPVHVWRGAVPQSELDEVMRDWRFLNHRASVPFSVARDLESYYYRGTDWRRGKKPQVKRRHRERAKKKPELFSEAWQPVERQKDPIFVRENPLTLPPRSSLGLCCENDVMREKLLILPRTALRRIVERLRECGYAMAKEATKGRRRIRCLLNPTWPKHFILWSAIAKA